MSDDQTVFVVDDNRGMRKAVSDFLLSRGLAVETFDSARAFLAAYAPSRAGCLILDIQMPGMSGLELQEHLLSVGASLPIIILSGHTAVADIVKTMKLGSFEFIEKPFEPDLLLERVREALTFERRMRADKAKLAELRARFDTLTARERQILPLVIGGKQSKVIAGEINLAVSTVDNHRANIMKKLKAKTPADLTRMALLIEPGLAFAADEPDDPERS